MNYEAELNNLRAAQQRAATANLENTRNQALSDLQAEQMKNTASYNAQRSTANAQNRMSARNFQEYLASTGRANSGLSAQARMQNANNLNTSLNTLNAGEAAAMADINRRTTDANNAYNTGLASANATIEANYIQNLLDQRNKELERQMQERQFNESVRQFNEQMAYNYKQLQQNFSRGSGSRRGSGGSTSYNDIDLSGNNNQQVKKQNNKPKAQAKVPGIWANKSNSKSAGNAEKKPKLSAKTKNALNKAGIKIKYK